MKILYENEKQTIPILFLVGSFFWDSLFINDNLVSCKLILSGKRNQIPLVTRISIHYSLKVDQGIRIHYSHVLDQFRMKINSNTTSIRSTWIGLPTQPLISQSPCQLLRVELVTRLPSSRSRKVSHMKSPSMLYSPQTVARMRWCSSCPQ